MRTLVIDTATRACSVALFDDDRVVASYHEVIGRGHAERLLPLIADLPERGRADKIAVNAGPGSFTGIRVGVAAARALGLAWAIPVAGYDCLTLIAAMAQAQTGRCDAVDVAMVGGHGEYFFGSFANGHYVDELLSLTPEDAAIKSHATTVAGDAATDVVARRGDGFAIDLLTNAACWHLIKGLPPLEARPIYGRAPDAAPPIGALR